MTSGFEINFDWIPELADLRISVDWINVWGFVHQDLVNILIQIFFLLL